jgi:hypothetical protein
VESDYWLERYVSDNLPLRKIIWTTQWMNEYLDFTNKNNNC